MAMEYRWIKILRGIYFDGKEEAPMVGDLVTLVRYEDVNTGERSYGLDGPDGSPGNQDPEITRYHGWRGTTNDISARAMGQRRVIMVQEDPDEPDFYEVRLSKDLHPEWA